MAKLTLNSKYTGFDVGNALWMVEAASLAYETNSDKVRDTLGGWGLSDVKPFDVSDSQGFLASNETTMVLAFRGTEPDKLADWMSDVNVSLVRGPAGRVHHGFSSALDAIWPQVYQAIDAQRRSGRRQTLWITGHSLGAALATLATARLRLDLDEVVNGLHTFGQPRTGDRDFARAFDQDFKQKTFRVVNNNDIVTRLPFRAMTYSHVGQFIYFDHDGKLDPDRRWWELLLDRVEGRMDDLLAPGTDGIEDHRIVNYRRCLQTAAEG